MSEDRAHLYIESIVPCPGCGGDLPLRLRVGFIEEMERLGVSEAEQFEAVANGLLARRIICADCREAARN